MIKTLIVGGIMLAFCTNHAMILKQSWCLLVRSAILRSSRIVAGIDVFGYTRHRFLMHFTACCIREMDRTTYGAAVEKHVTANPNSVRIDHGRGSNIRRSRPKKNDRVVKRSAVKTSESARAGIHQGRSSQRTPQRLIPSCSSRPLR